MARSRVGCRQQPFRCLTDAWGKPSGGLALVATNRPVKDESSGLAPQPADVAFVTADLRTERDARPQAQESTDGLRKRRHVLNRPAAQQGIEGGMQATQKEISGDPARERDVQGTAESAGGDSDGEKMIDTVAWGDAENIKVR